MFFEKFLECEYKILNNGKREDLKIKGLKSPFSLYITKKGELYITDENIIKKYDGKKLINFAGNLDSKNIKNKYVDFSKKENVYLDGLQYILVDEKNDIIYFTEKFNTGIKVIKNGEVYTESSYKNIYGKGLYILNGKLIVNHKFNYDYENIDLNNPVSNIENQKNKKLELFTKKFDDFIYKKTNGNPNEEIMNLKNNIIKDLYSYFENTNKEDRKYYKNEILKNVKELEVKLKEFKKVSKVETVVKENLQVENLQKEDVSEINSISDTKKFAVAISNVNMRKDPTIDSRVLSWLKKNDKVEIIEEIGDWYKIKFGDKEGFVVKKYLEISE